MDLSTTISDCSPAMRENFLHRELGRTGEYASAMALGCYSMSNAYGQRDDTESIRVIQRAIDLGVRIIDTADI